ncbi:hypothetical protein QQS21_006479 [Conoideocrella luteorostrata]|uniref:Glycolipid transfer protein domain-containing protein n=1 Tax=Conoideocrella luteorostrata TaxID=1105319 RepID=A0AAJ0CMG2_9HYPO|nr:hypothetical protein QQS21_006479 [Conoideocrella luteorostrata]
MATVAIPPGGTLLQTFRQSFVDVPVGPKPDQGVATTQFLDAAESLTTIFDVLGALAFSKVKEDMSTNIKKLRAQQLAAISDSETIQDLCRNELKAKKQTATEGLVWLLRALDLTCMALFQNIETENKAAADKNIKVEELSVSFKRAYNLTLMPHHPMGMPFIFNRTLEASCPYRDTFFKKLCSDDPEAIAKVKQQLYVYLEALKSIVKILKDFIQTCSGLSKKLLKEREGYGEY